MIFWLDNWLEGCAPADIWPHLFILSQDKERVVRELAGMMEFLPLRDFPLIHSLLDNLSTNSNFEGDWKHWRLSTNSMFTVTSFYDFLNDGRLHCRQSSIIWKGSCPRKINLFNWVAWDDKILSLENLALRRCNFFQTTTCVMCQADVETFNHLLTQCLVASHIWNFFGHLFEVNRSHISLSDIWGSQRKKYQETLNFVLGFSPESHYVEYLA